MSKQQEIIAALGVKPQISAEEEIRRRVDFLKDHVLRSGTTGLLIAISGGLDSAVAAGLCKKATDELREEKGMDYRTVGVLQPYGEQADIGDARSVIEAFQLEHAVEMNIAEAVDEIALETEYALKHLGIHRHISKEGKGNVKARTRMVMQYALAFEMNLLVCGTDHASEALTGFFTKYGDGAADLHPLGSLNKRQVRQLGEALGVPEPILTKVPTAGLWEGQTDEGELGMTYEENCDYLEGKPVDAAVQERIEKLYARSAHKREPIPRM